jgi:hypothetical protein
MKKIMLLVALLCTSVLNGMEPESSVAEAMADRQTYHGQSYMEALSPEIKVMIVRILNSYNNNLSLEENLEIILENIKTLSQINWEFNAIMNDLYHNNSKGGFKLLVHMIAKKLNRQPCEIAKKFKTPAAEKYSGLCEKLRIKIKEGNIVEVKNLLDEGADIDGFPVLPAVMTSTRIPSFAMVKFLLERGANPFANTPRGVTALYILNDLHKGAHEYAQIKLLLEKAMQQWGQ